MSRNDPISLGNAVADLVESGRRIEQHRQAVKEMEQRRVDGETPTSEAFSVLTQAMKADSNLAWSWQCNLAMAIYDESHPQCICEILDGKYKGHRPECAIVRAHDARHFNEHALSHEFCNNAAARFMKLCFDVDVTKSEEWQQLMKPSQREGK